MEQTAVKKIERFVIGATLNVHSQLPPPMRSWTFKWRILNTAAAQSVFIQTAVVQL